VLLRLSEGLLEETFAQLRECGSGTRECVCYWAGPIETPAVVDGLLHPTHAARRGYYEVDGVWLNAAWIELALRRRTIRAQVHTHAGEAFHSWLDDEYPIVRTPGFLSLVIPAFARASTSLEGAYLTQLSDSGSWEQLDPAGALEVDA
jgi:hypothetical protein